MTNTGAVPVSVYPYYVGTGGAQPNPTVLVRPGATVEPQITLDRPDTRGTFLFVDRAHLDEIDFTLRAIDLSRTAETWGTMIPVVRETGFTNGVVSLNDVPLDDKLRSTLRIYSLDSHTPTTVRVSVYGVRIDPQEPIDDTPLGSVDLALRDLSTLFPQQTVTTPGYLEVKSIDRVMNTQSFTKLRVDVKPLDSVSRIWAFVSVTHNETQHVTIVAPSK